MTNISVVINHGNYIHNAFTAGNVKAAKYAVVICLVEHAGSSGSELMHQLGGRDGEK